MFGDSSNEGKKLLEQLQKITRSKKHHLGQKKLYHPQSTYGGRIQISRASRSEKIETRQCYSEAFSQRRETEL